MFLLGFLKCAFNASENQALPGDSLPIMPLCLVIFYPEQVTGKNSLKY